AALGDQLALVRALGVGAAGVDGGGRVGVRVVRADVEAGAAVGGQGAPAAAAPVGVGVGLGQAAGLHPVLAVEGGPAGEDLAGDGAAGGGAGELVPAVVGLELILVEEAGE